MKPNRIQAKSILALRIRQIACKLCCSGHILPNKRNYFPPTSTWSCWGCACIQFQASQLKKDFGCLLLLWRCSEASSTWPTRRGWVTESVQSSEKEAKYVGEGTDKTAVYNCLKGHYKQGKPKVFSAVNGKSEGNCWKLQLGRFGLDCRKVAQLWNGYWERLWSPSLETFKKARQSHSWPKLVLAMVLLQEAGWTKWSATKIFVAKVNSWRSSWKSLVSEGTIRCKDLLLVWSFLSNDPNMQSAPEWRIKAILKSYK